MTGFILNSRPIEHRTRFHAAFGDFAKTWKIIDCPVLTAEPLTVALPASGAFDHVVFTSQIAAALFPFTPAWGRKKVLAVGEATAAAARMAGFTHVVDTGKDVDDLRRYLSTSGFGGALYPSAEDISADFALEFAGRVQRVVTYRMVPRGGLGLDELAPGWKSAPLLAPLFSRRSALVLADLLAKALADGDGAANIAAVGISADVMVDGPWTTRAVADEPTLAAVAQAAGRVAASMTEH
ncbi:MAG: uroporphyrinogen-III synthase [Rhodospirillaceae bacterium]